MRNKEVAEILLKKLDKNLRQHNWKIKISSDWFRYGIVFYEKKETRWISFRILLQEENECTKAFGFDPNVFFPQIEEILTPVLVKNGLVGSNYMKGEISASFKRIENFKNILPEKGIKIESEEDIDRLIDLLMKFIENEALPFFNRWSNFLSLYDFIQNKSLNQLWDILGQFAPMKRAVIYRLCNNENALDLINEYYKEQKGYYDEDSDDKDNIRYYNASKDLKESLEKTNPIYA